MSEGFLTNDLMHVEALAHKLRLCMQWYDKLRSKWGHIRNATLLEDGGWNTQITQVQTATCGRHLI